ncbi:MAG: OmpA family protein [Pseudomonadota bacterium]
MRGTPQQWMLGAPQVEALVDGGARTAIDGRSTHPITITTDGRNVRLDGVVNSEAERQDIVAAVQQTPLLVTLDAALRVLPRAEPFEFKVEKQPDGAIVLSGHVSNEVTRERLLARARTLSDGGAVSDQLILASGEPDAGWPDLAQTALEVLEHLRDGVVSATNMDAVIAGTAPDLESAQEAVSIANATPHGSWSVQIFGAEPAVDDFTFSAMKTDDGAVILDGSAPDLETREQLLQAAAAITEQTVGGTIDLADGARTPDWPETAKRGIAALELVANGLFVTDAEGSATLTAEVETDDDLARLLPQIGDDWQTEITVRDPTPDAKLQIVLADDVEGLVAEGLLPEGLTPGDLAAILPGLKFTALNRSGAGRPVEWRGALDGLNIVLPRFRSAKIELVGRSLSMRGKLERGYGSDGVEAAMRSAIGRDWELDFDLLASAPLAEVVFSTREDQIVLSGVLPVGVQLEDALALFGNTAGGEGLTGGGDGDSDAWLTSMLALSEGLPRFRNSSGLITDGQIELNGILLPGYPATDMQGWFEARLPEGWSAIIAADESPPDEGDRRANLTTGEIESYRRGYWLPDLDFAVSMDRCGDEIETVLAKDKILFVTGSARIDQTGSALLNRLAAVAVRCLNSSVFRLEVGGHTDSVGNDENNLVLSQQRADAVVAELIDRGVRSDAISSKGYGEASPIDTNNTAEGRARNRRISFDWSDGGE